VGAGPDAPRGGGGRSEASWTYGRPSCPVACRSTSPRCGCGRGAAWRLSSPSNAPSTAIRAPRPGRHCCGVPPVRLHCAQRRVHRDCRGAGRGERHTVAGGAVCFSQKVPRGPKRARAQSAGSTGGQPPAAARRAAAGAAASREGGRAPPLPPHASAPTGDQRACLPGPPLPSNNMAAALLALCMSRW
jgi:hypothetical protein